MPKYSQLQSTYQPISAACDGTNQKPVKVLASMRYVVILNCTGRIYVQTESGPESGPYSVGWVIPIGESGIFRVRSTVAETVYMEASQEKDRLKSLLIPEKIKANIYPPPQAQFSAGLLTNQYIVGDYIIGGALGYLASLLDVKFGFVNIEPPGGQDCTISVTLFRQGLGFYYPIPELTNKVLHPGDSADFTTGIDLKLFDLSNTANNDRVFVQVDVGALVRYYVTCKEVNFYALP